jgi:hypothetical protein
MPLYSVSTRFAVAGVEQDREPNEVGGHDVPRTDVMRRFKRGWTNFLAAGVGRGMRRAARAARELARMHGTPIYVWEDGKVVAKEP